MIEPPVEQGDEGDNKSTYSERYEEAEGGTTEGELVSDFENQNVDSKSNVKEQLPDAVTLKVPTATRDKNQNAKIKSTSSNITITSGSLRCRGTTVSEIIRKWRIKFSGKSGEDHETFLERIAEQRRFTNISESDLLRCLPVCLEGVAARWYESNESTWSNWEGFKKECRRFFGDPDYYENLERNAKDRRQGEDEPIRAYIVTMQAIFRRLKKSWSEEKKIKTVYWGAKSSLQKVINYRSIKSLRELEDQLLEAERRLEGPRRHNPKPSEMVYAEFAYDPKKYSKSKYTAAIETDSDSSGELPRCAHSQPRSNRKHKENYRGRTEQCANISNVAGTSNRNYEQRNPPPRQSEQIRRYQHRGIATSANKRNDDDLECWNCRKKGHKSKDCFAEPTIHCFRCGAPGTTLRQCRRCNRQAGNGRGSHSSGPEGLRKK